MAMRAERPGPSTGRGFARARRIRVACILVAACLAATGLAGCSSLGVQPWERDLLAQDAMAVDANPVDTALDVHIYFSKEASTGGVSLGGGGCGCN
jgi:hypothetical protein